MDYPVIFHVIKSGIWKQGPDTAIPKFIVSWVSDHNKKYPSQGWPLPKDEGRLINSCAMCQFCFSNALSNEVLKCTPLLNLSKNTRSQSLSVWGRFRKRAAVLGENKGPRAGEQLQPHPHGSAAPAKCVSPTQSSPGVNPEVTGLGSGSGRF